MTTLQKIALDYAGVLTFAALLNYIPGIRDDNGLCLGLFALDWFDDALHIGSALWALGAALWSHRAARVVLLAFGTLYLGDGIFGFFTGFGYLDAGIFIYGNYGMSFTLDRVLLNLPHIALGGFALWAGLRLARA